MRPALLLSILLLPAAMPALAQNAQVEADAKRLYACIEAAYPEGEMMPTPGQKPPARTTPGSCSGLVALSCKPRCEERESRAWLHLARQTLADDRAKRNVRAHAPVIGGLQRQALAICTAAASTSAWGSDPVAKGAYKPSLSHPCAREALAGMIIPLLGHARGN